MNIFEDIRKKRNQNVHRLIEGTHNIDEILDLRNYRGSTPLHYAIEFGNYKIAMTLISLCANLEATDNEGRTPIHYAKWEWRGMETRAIIRHLVDKGANVNAIDHYGETPLHNAMFHGCIETMKLLISKGADVKVTNSFGSTLLHRACKISYPWVRAQAIELLLSKGADIEATDNNGKTPLHWAIEKNDFEAIKVLVNKGATIPNEELINLARYSIEMMRSFINRNINVNAVSSIDKTSLLHIAARYRDLDIINTLIEKGANIEATDNKGKTPLHWAIDMNDFETIKVLVNKGANINTPSGINSFIFSDNSITPFQLAIIKSLGKENQHINILEFLINKGADINSTFSYGINIYTPLKWFHGYRRNDKMIKLIIDKGATIPNEELINLARDSIEMMRLLINRNINVNAVSRSDRSSLLHIAASYGDLDIVHTLIDKGANIEATDNRRKTPLYWAMRSKNYAVSKLLIQKGAKVKNTLEVAITDDNLYLAIDLLKLTRFNFNDIQEIINTVSRIKKTSLIHFAAKHGYLNIVHTLIGKGAYIDRHDSELRAPLYLAMLNENYDIGKLLVQKGAQVKDALEVAITNDNLYLAIDLLKLTRFNFNEIREIIAKISLKNRTSTYLEKQYKIAVENQHCTSQNKINIQGMTTYCARALFNMQTIEKAKSMVKIKMSVLKSNAKQAYTKTIDLLYIFADMDPDVINNIIGFAGILVMPVDICHLATLKDTKRLKMGKKKPDVESKSTEELSTPLSNNDKQQNKNIILNIIRIAISVILGAALLVPTILFLHAFPPFIVLACIITILDPIIMIYCDNPKEYKVTHSPDKGILNSNQLNSVKIKDSNNANKNELKGVKLEGKNINEKSFSNV